ncbi:MAG: hypothetical protein EOO07_00155 [Chitinophagaceae bacterium]|nr:MAG: hypothetical protein EOO07_00155 [Chitinophagaceae bacterium]
MKIAFFGNYILFEQKVLHHKIQTSLMDLKNTKDGDTTIGDVGPDMAIEKITHRYYVYRRGDKRGLFYDEARAKTKGFSVDTLFMYSNLAKGNEDGISFTLGNPNEVKKEGSKWSEKYYNLKKEMGIDTVIRYYDDALKELPFSISKKLDYEKNSKLIKTLLITKPPHSLDVKKNEPFKVEMLTGMELITERCSKEQLEKFKKYLNRYERETTKDLLTN